MLKSDMHCGLKQKHNFVAVASEKDEDVTLVVMETMISDLRLNMA